MGGKHTSATRLMRVNFDFRGSASFTFDADDFRYADFLAGQMAQNGDDLPKALFELGRALAYDDGIPENAEYIAENIEVRIEGND